MRRLLIAGCCAALAACGGGDQPDQIAENATVNATLPPSAANTPGVTPMNERVAVIGLLNKRNGIVRDLTLRPGQAIRLKDVVVRLRACEATAPWETERLTGAFLQVDVQRPDRSWGRVFSGWVYKESPSLNVVEHAVYDVWPKSCAMNWPSVPGLPDAPAATSNRSRASNSGGGRASRPAPAPEATPSTEPTPAEPAPPVPSEADSNST